MVTYFRITGSEGTYLCPVRLIDNVSANILLIIPTITQTFSYQISRLLVPGDDMWPEEFVVLAGVNGMQPDGWWTGSFYSTEADARTAIINKLIEMVRTYETWPHSNEYPYFP